MRAIIFRSDGMHDEFDATRCQLYFSFADLDIFDSVFNLFQDFLFTSVLVVQAYVAE